MRLPRVRVRRVGAYCLECGYDRDSGRHRPVGKCFRHPCPDPSEHHRYVRQPIEFRVEVRL